ncbi:uncharacterized protein LOC111005109 [Momordica charantia]|uniref:Uncharacterized protein LOC111005109 n=1 Tax=Momordica charantia TaxID=3673 RepID=A0A6J1BSD3_MOMCH|nr:uncharacterized protein LOC111005109 [Momordica charantia]
MKSLLPHTITKEQSAFVAGRQILDASLIANEIIEDWDRKKRKGVVIKLDIEKAFDKVDWDFLDEVLAAKGFRHTWRKWIWGCISTTNFSIIINGRPRGKRTASRGLRQGFDVGNNSLAIHHLQFADDTILLSPYDNLSLTNMFNIIRLFEEATGLNINH